MSSFLAGLRDSRAREEVAGHDPYADADEGAGRHEGQEALTQSVVAGMALSALGMVAAAAGWLPPVAGAAAQEGIDLAVILNALRALRD